MANLKLRSELTSAFRMHGLQLRQEAVKYGLAVVSQVERLGSIAAHALLVEWMTG